MLALGSTDLGCFTPLDGLAFVHYCHYKKSIFNVCDGSQTEQIDLYIPVNARFT